MLGCEPRVFSRRGISSPEFRGGAAQICGGFGVVGFGGKWNLARLRRNIPPSRETFAHELLFSCWLGYIFLIFVYYRTNRILKATCVYMVPSLLRVIP